MLLAATPPPAAAPARVARAFGATIVSTYPDGRTAELWLAPDGAYTAEGRRFDRSRGHWRVKGSKLCLRQSRPFPSPFSYCTAIPPADASGSWTGKAWSGEAIRIRLVPGHVEGQALATRKTAAATR